MFPLGDAEEKYIDELLYNIPESGTSSTTKVTPTPRSTSSRPSSLFPIFWFNSVKSTDAPPVVSKETSSFWRSTAVKSGVYYDNISRGGITGDKGKNHALRRRSEGDSEKVSRHLEQQRSDRTMLASGASSRRQSQTQAATDNHWRPSQMFTSSEHYFPEKHLWQKEENVEQPQAKEQREPGASEMSVEDSCSFDDFLSPAFSTQTINAEDSSVDYVDIDLRSSMDSECQHPAHAMERQSSWLWNLRRLLVAAPACEQCSRMEREMRKLKVTFDRIWKENASLQEEISKREALARVLIQQRDQILMEKEAVLEELEQLSQVLFEEANKMVNEERRRAVELKDTNQQLQKELEETLSKLSAAAAQTVVTSRRNSIAVYTAPPTQQQTQQPDQQSTMASASSAASSVGESLFGRGISQTLQQGQQGGRRRFSIAVPPSQLTRMPSGLNRNYGEGRRSVESSGAPKRQGL
ncbi:hypothetical protein HK102_001173 [Quaeritorhiza haematococci]|nr:hypothetical protein HK102_001173 [Quaeritorhiza haematococci]